LGYIKLFTSHLQFTDIHLAGITTKALVWLLLFRTHWAKACSHSSTNVADIYR